MKFVEVFSNRAVARYVFVGVACWFCSGHFKYVNGWKDAEKIASPIAPDPIPSDLRHAMQKVHTIIAEGPSGFANAAAR